MAERDPVEVLTEQVKALGARNAELTVQTLELETTMKRLQTSHAALEKERDRLQAELDAQSGTRPDVSFQALGEHLSLAVAAMEAQTPSGARFRAGSARFDIRVALGLDADGAPILRLPSLGEAIDPATLSTVTVDLVPSELDDVDFDSLVVVPKLTGGDAALAARLLADAGLAVGATVEIDSPDRAGTVVSQDPLPGDYVEPGTPIDLRVAAADVGVPDLAGLGLVDARTVLARSALQLGLVTQEESEKPAGTVVAQAPKPDLRVVRGSVVDVTVAVPRTVEVPSLVGADVEKAKAILDEAGLRLGSADGRASVEPRGVVISQAPSAGTDVDVGTPIAVVVSLGGIVRAEPVPDVLGLSRADALARLEGWVPVVVSVVDDGAELDTVVEQAPEGGTVTTDRSVELSVPGSGAPVVDVNGIGAATSAKLARVGIRTVGDLVVASSEVVAEATGFSLDRVRELQAAAAELQSR